ncbi:MAG: hypothetical protein QY332_07590 [Anaerolineales bacterium]|nr:MAG: hypothetical protein QY332_07590 [Anaerolineales bacterium]
MTTQKEKACLSCNRTDDQTPLLHMIFKNETKYICAQCLPVLIHKTYMLADKLPGIEIISDKAD